MFRPDKPRLNPQAHVEKAHEPQTRRAPHSAISPQIGAFEAAYFTTPCTRAADQTLARQWLHTLQAAGSSPRRTSGSFTPIPTAIRERYFPAPSSSWVASNPVRRSPRSSIKPAKWSSSPLAAPAAFQGVIAARTPTAKLPVLDGDGFPVQTAGLTAYPGLYFVGLPWLPSAKTGLRYGVGDNARVIAKAIMERDGKLGAMRMAA